uniref:ubiquitinyl hydrolase 1 n=2 Tax=Clytia hemisphaerica TaxID=252671 RepID=A0A7M5XJJ8_9CNID
MFEFDQTVQDEDKDSYHFVAYLPINGRMYELDGLKEGPIDLGASTYDKWLENIKPIIERRMQRYSAEEIHFNLMAVVSDRQDLYSKQINELKTQKDSLMQSGMETDQIKIIDDEISRCHSMLEREKEKLQRYKTENVRRKHNYLPFIMELLRILAKKQQLVPLVDKAKEVTKTRREQDKARKRKLEEKK